MTATSWGPPGRDDDVGSLADAVAVAARSVPGVVGLSGGPLSNLATYLPGRSVTGVQVRDDAVTVGVVVAWEGLDGTTPRVVAGRVHDAVVPEAGGRTVHVAVQDIAVEGSTDEDTSVEDTSVEDSGPVGDARTAAGETS